MRASVFSVSCLALLCLLAVSASARSHHEPAHSAPHPVSRNTTDGFSPETHGSMLAAPDAETAAQWEKIYKQLEARNFSWPAHQMGAKEHHAHAHAGHHERHHHEAPTPNGGRGVDISAWAGATTWKCLKSKGYTTGVVRNFRSICSVDPNGVHSVANGWSAGMEHMDIYMFPAVSCGLSGSDQVDQTIDSMGSIPFGRIWFDIETGAGWSTDNKQANVNWLEGAVNQAMARIGVSRIGIYSSQYMWSTIMGASENFRSLPLWYAHYDNSAGFGDFVSFGGWTSPFAKQYAGSSTVCSMGVDLDYLA